jgi:hypothetical protein
MLSKGVVEGEKLKQRHNFIYRLGSLFGCMGFTALLGFEKGLKNALKGNYSRSQSRDVVCWGGVRKSTFLDHSCLVVQLTVLHRILNFFLCAVNVRKLLFY